MKQASGPSTRNPSGGIASPSGKDDAPVQDGSTNERRNGGHTSTTSSTPAAGDGKSGFNIAEHLQKNADINMERTDGSLSPEMNQFLEDIGSVVQSFSPSHSQRKECASDGEGSESKSQLSPHHKPQPKIAANFGMSNAIPGLDHGQVVDTSNSQSSIPDSTTITKAVDPHVAASKIQQWYRQNKSSKRTVSRVHSLLASKRDELNRSRSEELQRIQLELEAREMKEKERERRRAAKMQAARRAAIEDLKRKREEKRERAERIAQEEIVSCHRNLSTSYQGSPKLTKSCSHFPKILQFKAGCEGNIGYSIQGLVAKVKDTVANG